MRRRLLALAAALLMGAAVLVGSATPAQAACPTADYEDIKVTFADGYNVVGTVRFIDCGTYVRLDWGWMGSSYPEVVSWYNSATYGNPALQVYSGGTGGPIVAQYIASVIPYSTLAQWDNVYCADPCVARIKGRANKPSTDYQFITYDEIELGGDS